MIRLKMRIVFIFTRKLLRRCVAPPRRVRENFRCHRRKDGDSPVWVSLQRRKLLHTVMNSMMGRDFSRKSYFTAVVCAAREIGLGDFAAESRRFERRAAWRSSPDCCARMIPFLPPLWHGPKFEDFGNLPR